MPTNDPFPSMIPRSLFPTQDAMEALYFFLFRPLGMELYKPPRMIAD